MVVQHQIIVGHLLEYKAYLELKGYKKHTVSYSIAHVREYLEYQNKEPVTLSQYFKYLENRPNKNNPKLKLAKSSLNGVILSIEKYFNYLEFIKNEPITIYKIPYYKFAKKDIIYLSVEEAKKLIDTAKIPSHKAMLTCLYHLGLRASEVINLKTKDIDLKKNLVFIAGSKTGNQRYVPINKTAQQILKEYLTKKHQDYLFTGAFKEQTNVHYLRGIVKKYAKEAGITKRVYSHLLRHSIATHLLQQGMQLEKIAQFLGHTSLDSTHRYTHFNL